MDDAVWRPLIGQKACGAWIGHGSALFLEFGEPRPLEAKQRHAKGEWTLSNDTLMVWRVERGDTVVTGSEDDRKTIEAGLAQVNGRRLLAIRFENEIGDISLSFEDDLSLRSFVNRTELSDEGRWWVRDSADNYHSIDPKYAGPARLPATQEQND